ncbi:MAG TPA: hypothetical protein VH186_18225 [Chloroflexia bacterium]|nr:hypothetical protein [Chloroflexia bacterium]
MIKSTSSTPSSKVIDKPASGPGKGLARRADWLALLLYTLLTVLVTFPLAFQLNSHIIGGGPTSDSYQNIWYMWWYGKALEQGLDPTRTNLMYGLLPDVQVLISSILNGLLLWPFVKLFGALAAYNISMLVSFPLSGFFAFKLADDVLEKRNRPAAFAAGFFFTFSTYHLFRLEGHLGLVTVQWLPFYLWRLFRLQHRPNLPNALLTGLGLAFAALSDLYYLGYFVLPVTLFFLAWFAIRERRTFFQWKNLRFYGLALVFGLVLITPFYSFFLHLDPDVSRSVGDRSSDVRDFSADLLAFFLPNSQNPIFGGLTAPLYQKFKSMYLIEEAVYPGYILSGLALGGLFLRRMRNWQSYFWLTLAFLAFIFALGPRLHIAGQEVGPTLPYGFIYGKLPLLTNFRAPNRFGIIIILALAVLAALTLNALQEKLAQGQSRMVIRYSPAIIAGMLLLSLAETTVYSLPQNTDLVTIPAVYRQIAAEPGDFKVLELPLDTRSEPLYYQIFHEKRLVGGLATRISNRMTLSWDQAGYLGMFNPAESSAIINNGQALKAPGGPDIFPLDLSFRQVLEENKIGYVTLRTTRPAFAWMRDYLVQQLGQPTSQEVVQGEPLLAWRLLPLINTTPPPVAPGNFRIHLGEGWNAGLGKGEDGSLLRLVSQNAQLLVTPGQVGPATFSLTTTPYIRPQTIEIYVNGKLTGQIEGKEPWKPLSTELPINLNSGQNVIELHSKEGCLFPVDYIPNSTDQRCISFAVQKVKITAK